MLRFAPSPIGDMNIAHLRIAIFNYIIASLRDEQFIVRIEDIDKDNSTEGKDEEILLILEKFALPHSQRFNQSDNIHIHQSLAIRLLKEKKAFVCICSEKDDNICKCNNIDIDVKTLKEDNVPFVIKISKSNDIDSFIILKPNGLPTYDFACACDDMLSGVNYVLRGEDYLGNTPKQIYIKHLLGYEDKTEYKHIPNILNADDITVKWLFQEGFIPDAILNYLISLGNDTPIEIFTLPDALEWFDLSKISKSPVKFDIEKLKLINREHLKLMDSKKLSSLFGFSDTDIGELAKVYLEEVSTINELKDKIEALFAPKDFDVECGVQMRVISDIIANAPMINDFSDLEKFITKESGLSGNNLSKPLSYLLTGAENGTELSKIYPYIKSYILEVAS